MQAFAGRLATALKNEQTGEVLYTPPQSHEEIVELMGSLEQFMNDERLSDLGPLVKMAIIHHQFESIHRFMKDGQDHPYPVPGKGELTPYTHSIPEPVHQSEYGEVPGPPHLQKSRQISFGGFFAKRSNTYGDQFRPVIPSAML